MSSETCTNRACDRSGTPHGTPMPIRSTSLIENTRTPASRKSAARRRRAAGSRSTCAHRPQATASAALEPGSRGQDGCERHAVDVPARLVSGVLMSGGHGQMTPPEPCTEASPPSVPSATGGRPEPSGAPALSRPPRAPPRARRCLDLREEAGRSSRSAVASATPSRHCPRPERCSQGSVAAPRGRVTNRGWSHVDAATALPGRRGADDAISRFVMKSDPER
jgi:hypothetical protein